MASADKSIPFIVSSQPVPRPAVEKQSRTPDLESETESKRLRSLLGFTGDFPIDNQRALYAIAFLLEWGSNTGNDPLDGMASNGLAQLVRKAAADVQKHERFMRLVYGRKAAQ
jgi:hypothetical protein